MEKAQLDPDSRAVPKRVPIRYPLAMPTRRDFLTGSAAASLGLLMAPRSARAADARIEVLLDEPIGTIAPEIYGHFAENLGGVVYDGIWVGEDSPIPNIGGIRRELVERLRAIQAPVIRWPGGCFADSYDWRDGIGAIGDRPTRTNFWLNTRVPPGPQQYDPNEFGTIEFARFCRLAGAEPYLAANVRSLPPRDFYQWVEFANSPAGTTTLADARAAQGESGPLGVRYWGIGNEPWGCGGDMTPEDYAREFRRFTSWVPGYDVGLRFIGAGPSGGQYDRTRRFFETLTEANRGLVNRVWGWSVHHYSTNVSGGRSNDWNASKGPATGFTREQWFELLVEGDHLDGFIDGHAAVLDDFDPAGRVKLVIDEWGSWHRPGSEAVPVHTLGQVSTLRDALLAGLSLDIFHRHADRVGMANLAQLVNCLQSLFVADGDRFVLTPNYHVFDMYKGHMGARAVRSEFSAPEVSYDRNGREAAIWGLNGSASVSGSTLTLTAVNPNPDAPIEAEIAVRGGRVASGTVRTLTAGALDAHNSFAQPDAVPAPAATAIPTGGDTLVLTFPRASVSALTLTLG
jgi:alpha-N-arabinofuranosidase